MAISATSPVASTPAASQPAPHASTVDYDSFLKLLVTQLQNQDPTAPTDATAFMSQLASFSNVEQGVKSNAKLDSLISMAQITQADSLIGRTATSANGETSGIVRSVRVDSNGVVATLESGATLNVASGLTLS